MSGRDSALLLTELNVALADAAIAAWDAKYYWLVAAHHRHPARGDGR